MSPVPWEGRVNSLPLFATGTELLRMQIKPAEDRGQAKGQGSKLAVPATGHWMLRQGI